MIPDPQTRPKEYGKENGSPTEDDRNASLHDVPLIPSAPDKDRRADIHGTQSNARPEAGLSFVKSRDGISMHEQSRSINRIDRGRW
jgi:hypothetical protein